MLFLEIPALIFGIIALATGEFKLTRKRVVTGDSARMVGVMLVLPLPLSLAAGLAMGAMFRRAGPTYSAGRNAA